METSLHMPQGDGPWLQKAHADPSTGDRLSVLRCCTSALLPLSVNHYSFLESNMACCYLLWRLHLCV